jgi:transcriptional regulator with XRE-family HTH domain
VPSNVPDFEELRFAAARLRRTRRWTLDQLAERSGVGRRALVQLEAGESRGSIETWFKLAEAFDMENGEMLSPLYGPMRRR